MRFGKNYLLSLRSPAHLQGASALGKVAGVKEFGSWFAQWRHGHKFLSRCCEIEFGRVYTVCYWAAHELEERVERLVGRVLDRGPDCHGNAAHGVCQFNIC